MATCELLTWDCLPIHIRGFNYFRICQCWCLQHYKGSFSAQNNIFTVNLGHGPSHWIVNSDSTVLCRANWLKRITVYHDGYIWISNLGTDNSVYLFILPCVSICCNFVLFCFYLTNVYSHVDLIAHILFYILQPIILHLDFIHVNVLCFIAIDHCCCILFDLSEMTK